MRVVERFEAWGHRMISGTHKTTFEFTKNDSLTKRGDCIVGVRASKGAFNLSEDFKDLAQGDDSRIEMRMEVDGIIERVWGRGSRELNFTHLEDMVVRRSRFSCGRTVMVSSSKAAADLSRELVKLMQNPDRRMTVTLSAYSGDRPRAGPKS